MSGRLKVSFMVNGARRTVETDPGRTLLEVLREDLRLTGTKAGCQAGECGACTVLLDGEPVTSCLVPIGAVEGCSIETVEGLGRAGSSLHVIQQALVEEGAVQCGFCTPGIAVSSVALLRENPHPNELEIREALAGNLCRCTGYSRVGRAVERVAREEGRS